MVGEFVREMKLINELRKQLSEITGTTPDELSDYYCLNELINCLVED